MKLCPTHVKGKELGPHHFYWRYTIALTEKEIEEKTEDLWNLVKQILKREDLIENLKAECIKKRGKTAWERISPIRNFIKSRGEGKEIAGMMIVEQLALAEEAWNKFRKPFLRLKTCPKDYLNIELKKAIELEDILGKHLKEEEKNGKRHYLALLLLTIEPRIHLEGWGRELIGPKFLSVREEPILAMTHGTTVERQWIEPSLIKTETAIKRAENLLTETEMLQINPWKR